jgi:hypothetical protein
MGSIEGFEPELGLSSDGYFAGPFGADFCQAVFGRQLSAQDLDRCNYNVKVDDLDASVEAIKSFKGWDAQIIDKDTFQMRIAVAQLISDDPSQMHMLFLHQDMLEQ